MISDPFETLRRVKQVANQWQFLRTGGERQELNTTTFKEEIRGESEGSAACQELILNHLVEREQLERWAMTRY